MYIQTYERTIMFVSILFVNFLLYLYRAFQLLGSRDITSFVYIVLTVFHFFSTFFALSLFATPSPSYLPIYTRIYIHFPNLIVVYTFHYRCTKHNRIFLSSYEIFRYDFNLISDYIN